MALRDFDADGDLDLIIVAGFRMAPAAPLYFDNNGAGVFSDVSATRVPPTSSSRGLDVLDIDADGDLDVAQASQDLINNGAGYFTATSVSANRLLVADLDQDGSADGIVEVSGLGVLGGVTVFQDDFSPGHIVLPADLDQDGDLDLVVSSIDDGAGSTYNWRKVRVEAIYNLRRDLRVLTPPRVGRPYRLRLRATGGPTVAFVACAGAVLSPRLQIPGVGALLLDPAALIPIAVTVIPNADTAAEPSVALPNQPALQGLVLSCQALMVSSSGTHLTNAMSHTIEY